MSALYSDHIAPLFLITLDRRCKKRVHKLAKHNQVVSPEQAATGRNALEVVDLPQGRPGNRHADKGCARRAVREIANNRSLGSAHTVVNPDRSAPERMERVGDHSGLIDMFEKHATKGRLVYVDGKLQTRRWSKPGSALRIVPARMSTLRNASNAIGGATSLATAALSGGMRLSPAAAPRAGHADQRLGTAQLAVQRRHGPALVIAVVAQPHPQRVRVDHRQPLCGDNTR